MGLLYREVAGLPNRVMGLEEAPTGKGGKMRIAQTLSSSRVFNNRKGVARF